MKRFSLLLALPFLIVILTKPAFGQDYDFGPRMKVFSDSSYTAVFPNVSESEQFPKESDDLTEGLRDILENNSQALKQLVSEADDIIIFGLQDESGEYINGLGERRARAVAKVINEMSWHKQANSWKVTTQEFALANDPKTRILKRHQEFINMRSVAIVAHYDNTVANSDTWWPAWLMWLLGGLSLLALVVALLSWLGNNNESNQQRDNGSQRGNQRNTDESNTTEPNGDAATGHEADTDTDCANNCGTEDAINVFLYQEINGGEGDIDVDPPQVFLADNS